MKLLNVRITEDCELKIMGYTCEVPNTEYVDHYFHDVLIDAFHDNMVDFLTQLDKETTFYFTKEDYVDLAEFLEQSEYTLAQALTIIRWIEQVVAGDSPDSSWGTVYLEILEGASDE